MSGVDSSYHTFLTHGGGGGGGRHGGREIEGGGGGGGGELEEEVQNPCWLYYLKSVTS